MKKTLIALLLLINVILINPAKADSCDLPNIDTNDAGSLGSERPNGVVPSTGTVKYKVIFIKYSDSGKLTKKYAKELYEDIDFKEVSKYYQESSFGKLKIKFDSDFVWHNTGQDSSVYQLGLSNNPRWKEAENGYFASVLSTVNSKINLSGYSGVVIISDPKNYNIMGGVAFGTPQTINNTSLRAVVLGNILEWTASPTSLTVHEIGHNFGLDDLYRNTQSSTGDTVGQFSVMNNSLITTDFLGWEKRIMGWDVKSICHSKGIIEQTLTPISYKGGTKMIIIKLGNNKNMVIEARKPGYADKYLSTSGIIAYIVDSSIRTGSNPITVLYDQWVLPKNKTITSDGISITYLGKDKNGYKVMVSN